MKKLKEMIEVMKAFDEGKEIECRFIGNDAEQWCKFYTSNWNWEDFDYRIKPEPVYMTCEQIYDKLEQQLLMAVKKRSDGSVVAVNSIDFKKQEIIIIDLTKYDYPERRISYSVFDVKNLNINYTFLDGSGFIKEN